MENELHLGSGREREQEVLNAEGLFVEQGGEGALDGLSK